MPSVRSRLENKGGIRGPITGREKPAQHSRIRKAQAKIMTGTAILNQYPATPELDKLKAIQDKSQVCGEFLEWLEVTHGMQLGKGHIHGPECDGWDEERQKYNPDRDNRCSFYEGQFQHLHISREKLLAQFFEIDLDKVEEERRAILDHIRRDHAA